jgi:small subunit ribosomal protein S7
MKDGKKLVAEKITYGVLDTVVELKGGDGLEIF